MMSKVEKLRYLYYSKDNMNVQEKEQIFNELSKDLEIIEKLKDIFINHFNGDVIN